MNGIQVLRVFLASPSDLSLERRAARAAVEEINKTVARPAGYQVDLIGWEDTLSTIGRPQAVINEDLETCELFIGMLHARWGTPPDTEGKFTSGFEEEFSLSTKRNAERGEPAISLFFKDVELSKLADPGPELSKVIAFREKIISEKKILFETFPDPEALGQKIRYTISAFIHKITSQKKKEIIPNGVPVQKPKQDVDAGSVKPGGMTHSAIFLDVIAEEIRKNEGAEISSVEVAQLRNLAIALGRGGNDDETIGAHDANLIYRSKNKLSLSDREVTALADGGVEAFSNENKPMWSWLVKRLEAVPGWLAYSTAFGPERRRVGSLQVMALLRLSLPEDDVLNPDAFADTWFNDDSSAILKNSALEYISVCRHEDLIEFARKEFDSNNFATRNSAIDAIIASRSQTGAKEAALEALDISFDYLSEKRMAIVLKGMLELDNSVLTLALEHRSGPVRAQALTILGDRGVLSEPQMQRFFGDASIEMRIAAVAAFEKKVRPLSHEEAEAALVLKTPSPNPFAIGGRHDFAGIEALREHKRRRFLRKSMSDIEAGIASEIFDLDDYYLARAESNFKTYQGQIRHDIDNRFRDLFDKIISRVNEKYGASAKETSLSKMIEDQREFRCKQMTRRAFDILLAKDAQEDLVRFRRALDEDAIDPHESDIKYLQKHGSWEDVSRIAKIAADHRTLGYRTTTLGSQVLTNVAAPAILRLSAGKAAELLSADISSKIQAKVIYLMSMSAFRTVDRAVLDSALRHKEDAVRKAVCLKILDSFDRKFAQSVLNGHISSGDQVYYNVIFWLDLAVAFSRERYREIIKREIEKVE